MSIFQKPSFTSHPTELAAPVPQLQKGKPCCLFLPLCSLVTTMKNCPAPSACIHKRKQILGFALLSPHMAKHCRLSSGAHRFLDSSLMWFRLELQANMQLQTCRSLIISKEVREKIDANKMKRSEADSILWILNRQAPPGHVQLHFHIFAAAWFQILQLSHEVKTLDRKETWPSFVNSNNNEQQVKQNIHWWLLTTTQWDRVFETPEAKPGNSY